MGYSKKGLLHFSLHQSTDPWCGSPVLHHRTITTCCFLVQDIIDNKRLQQAGVFFGRGYTNVEINVKLTTKISGYRGYTNSGQYNNFC